MFCILLSSSSSKLWFFDFEQGETYLLSLISLEVDFSIIFHCAKKWFLSIRCNFFFSLISLTISSIDLTLETFYRHDLSLSLSTWRLPILDLLMMPIFDTNTLDTKVYTNLGLHVLFLQIKSLFLFLYKFREL